jgi:hypothetical protein
MLAGGFAVAGFAGIGAVHADPITSPVGTATVNEGGYVITADGDASNPDPFDGYVSVSSSGKACASDQGSPDDGTSTPTCPN